MAEDMKLHVPRPGGQLGLPKQLIPVHTTGFRCTIQISFCELDTIARFTVLDLVRQI